MMGRGNTVRLYGSLIYGTFVAIALFAVLRLTDPWTALGLAALPLGLPLVRTVASSAEGPSLISVLKDTARLQVIVAALIAAGAAVG